MTRLRDAGVRPTLYGRHAYQPVLGFVEPHPGLGFDGQRVAGVTANAHFR